MPTAELTVHTPPCKQGRFNSSIASNEQPFQAGKRSSTGASEMDILFSIYDPFNKGFLPHSPGSSLEKQEDESLARYNKTGFYLSL